MKPDKQNKPIGATIDEYLIQELDNLGALLDSVLSKKKNRNPNEVEAALRIQRVYPRDESITEKMDYIRMHLKYVCLDLDATKKENKYLRQKIEEQG